MKSTNKFTWIIFIGAPAVGKYTIANAISKKMKWVFFHNHLIIDFVKSILPHEHTIPRRKFRFKMIENFLNYFGEQEISIVMTHAYAHDYTTEWGQTDPDYIKHIEEVAKKHGGKCIVIHLKAGLKMLQKRTTSIDRKQFGKISTRKLLTVVHGQYDFETSPEHMENLYVIETGDHNEKKTIDMVIKVLR